MMGVAHVLSTKAHSKPLTVLAKVAYIEDAVAASGTIQPYKLINVGAQASGRIVALHVVLGDRVSKGQLVAEIDPSTQRNALATAQAVLDQAQASRESRAIALQQAELTYRRARVTYPQEATSRADYEAADAAFKGAEKGRCGPGPHAGPAGSHRPSIPRSPSLNVYKSDRAH